MKLQHGASLYYRSSQYIDYEKLKAILKKAKVSATHRDDILKRMPAATAAEVAHERRDRSTSDLVSRGTTIPSPTNTGEYSTPMQMGHHQPFELSSAKNSSSSLPVATDSTPLLNSSPMNRTTSWGNLGLKVTSYLGLADDKALLMQAYDNADNALNLFRVTYDEEVSCICIDFQLDCIRHIICSFYAYISYYTHSMIHLNTNT